MSNSIHLGCMPLFLKFVDQGQMDADQGPACCMVLIWYLGDVNI